MNRRCAWLAALCFISCTPTPAASPAASAPEGFGDPPPPAHSLESDVSFHGGGDDEPAADSSAAPSDSAPSSSAASTDSAPAAESAEAPPAPTRSAREVLTTPGAAFMIDYSGSDLKQAAEQKCDQAHADDPQARAACMTKARDDFQADVLSFQKAGGGWALVIYKRKGSSLAEVSKAAVDFADDKPDSVAIQIKSEQGSRPIFKRTRQFVVTLPNTYSLVVTEPDLGELHYDAKIGLVGSGANR